MRGSFFGGPKQPIMVIASMLMAISHEDAMIFCGYVKGDDIWHFISDFRKMFEGMKHMVESNATLHFPYEFRDKLSIYQLAIKSELLPYIWWCEENFSYTKTPEGRKPCGKCASCRSMNLFQYQYAEQQKLLESLKYDADEIKPVKESVETKELE